MRSPLELKLVVAERELEQAMTLADLARCAVCEKIITREFTDDDKPVCAEHAPGGCRECGGSGGGEDPGTRCRNCRGRG